MIEPIARFSVLGGVLGAVIFGFVHGKVDVLPAGVLSLAVVALLRDWT